MSGHAIEPARRLTGEVMLPGDKSVSHRALLFSALATGKSVIHGLSAAQDPKSTVHCLRALGIEVHEERNTTEVIGRGTRGFSAPAAALDCGNSGTTMRLLCGILSGQTFESTLTGDGSLMKRPMKRVLGPLAKMGASISGTPGGTAPIAVKGNPYLRPLRFIADVPSAQVKSAILLAGMYAAGETTVVEPIPTRDHTERMLGLKSFDVPEGRAVTTQGGMSIPAREYSVPGDTSAAVFLIAAASLLPGSDILLKRVSVNPTRAQVFERFRRLGVSLEVVERVTVAGEEIADVRVRASGLSGALDISAPETASVIDEIPMLAVAAAVAGCSFRLRGAQELRVKESDRIELLVKNLRSMEVEVEEYADGFAFGPNNAVIGGRIGTAGDHRIAMAFGVAGLVVPGVILDDASCVEVSFPGFWNTIDRLRSH
ncbi:MAG: 3-phosphoshikimate 1-carboxyvinyltransferase [Ignavibacteria bacterium RIFCSPHIGHO2_02_FULL_56_12]|nr:MAG: 3-phosphoshikimate 1-carboxyvinyltransferase [Ignavibacteria bacterium RIFCSPHIGHO2_02_FULL_56_12]